MRSSILDFGVDTSTISRIFSKVYTNSFFRDALAKALNFVTSRITIVWFQGVCNTLNLFPNACNRLTVIWYSFEDNYDFQINKGKTVYRFKPYSSFFEMLLKRSLAQTAWLWTQKFPALGVSVVMSLQHFSTLDCQYRGNKSNVVEKKYPAMSSKMISNLGNDPILFFKKCVDSRYRDRVPILVVQRKDRRLFSLLPRLRMPRLMYQK